MGVTNREILISVVTDARTHAHTKE